MGNFVGLAAVVGFLFLLGMIWLGVWFIGATLYFIAHYWVLILACFVVYFLAKKSWDGSRRYY